MGYASDAQRKAVHASKADGGKGNPNKMLSPAEMHCTGKKPAPLKNERRKKNRADVKEAKKGLKGKEKRQAARAERKKQRDEGRRGVKRTVEKVKETVEKVRDSRVGRAVEGAVNTVNAVKSGNIKKAVEGVKKTASAFTMLDPMTGMPMQSQMSNMPPQPSNTMGNARPVFNSRSQDVANNIYGGMQARQNAAGATPVYPNEMPVQTPLFNHHEMKPQYFKPERIKIQRLIEKKPQEKIHQPMEQIKRLHKMPELPQRPRKVLKVLKPSQEIYGYNKKITN